MVRGLERFRDHFAAYADRYVIIGGTACDLAMNAAGLAFRATKDIDVVLCLETVDAAFGNAFWSFVRSGAYESMQTHTGERQFFRFAKPHVDGFPAMIELFSRVPDVFAADVTGRLTPIPIDNDISSLSAILLNSDYYHWIHAGRTLIEGLPVVRPEHMIPLKAKAWLDLTERLEAGHHVDSKDIRKHRNDVFRLYAIADPEHDTRPTPSIRADMRAFIVKMRDEDIDLTVLGLGKMSLQSVLDDVSARYSARTS